MQAPPLIKNTIKGINKGAVLALLFIALCCGWLNNAAATTSTTTLTQANQSRMSNEAEQLALQGRYGDAAARFEALAAQTGGTDRDRYLLKAARYAQLAGDDSKSQVLLSLLSKNLSAADAAQRTVINAIYALHLNQPDRAIAQLDQIPLPLPAGQAAEILQVRTQALFAQGRTALAVNTAVERERELRSAVEISRNRQVIWDGLRQAATDGRDLTPPAGASRITAGWLELASLSSSHARDPFAMSRSLADWRARYPDHPGGTMIAAPGAAVAPRATNERIALLLPLSGRQQAAGIAVRDGFIAAALQNRPGAPNDIQVFDTNQAGALDAYQRALQAGAGMVIGPLLKEDVEALAKTQQIGVMTLALNALSDTQTPPGLMFQFALDPEEEARQVAQRASREGFTRAIVLAPNNDWGLRVQRAFAAELAAQGGTLVDQRYYDPAARDHVGLSKQLLESRKPPEAQVLEDALSPKRTVIEARDDFDYIFMAAQATQAKQLRPALRFVLPDTRIPIYATSDSYEPESADNNDLEGLRFIDMPWVINRDAQIANLHDSMSRLWGASLRSRSRLYAFGIDAFNLVNWLKTPQPQLATPLRGVTGLLALDQSGRVRRQSDWAQIINGKPQALPDLLGATLR